MNFIRYTQTEKDMCTYEPRHDKTNKMSVRPAKTQISLGNRPVWSESSLCAPWVAKDPMFLHADSEDSDQTGRHIVGFVMSRLNYFVYGVSAIRPRDAVRPRPVWTYL